MRPLAVLLAVALVACAPETAAPPSVAPSAATPSAAVPISVGRSAACASVAALSTSNASPTPAPRDRPMPTPAPPGRYLFAKDSTTLQLYASGWLSEFALPTLLNGSRATLAADGSLVSALLSDIAGQRTLLWTSDGALVPLNVPFLGIGGWVEWSPDAHQLGIVPDLERADEIYLASTDKKASRATPGGIVLDLGWRHPDELTFLAGPSRSYPVRGATLWSWRGGSQPVRLGTLDVASPSIAWREDGAMLAYVGVAADGAEAIHVREVTTQNEISDRIIFTVDDVVGAKAGCGLRRDELRFGLLSWQAGGLLAIGVHTTDSTSYDWLVAVVTQDGTLRGAVRTPGNCYLPFATWAARTPVLVAMLHGPDCGETSFLNRALLVDKAGAVMREVTIPRKGTLLLSGVATWGAIPGADDVTVMRLNGTEERYVIPLARFLGWCCAE